MKIVASVASDFVDFVDKYDWSKAPQIPEQDTRVLIRLLRTAGFEGRMIEEKTLYHIDGHGRSNKVNTLCPYTVLIPEKGDDVFATGWLDCALRLVVVKKEDEEAESRESRIEAIADEIERSIPLQPIILTEQGDRLVEKPLDIEHPKRWSYEAVVKGYPYFLYHASDSEALERVGIVGIHEPCGGPMERHTVSGADDMLLCKKCGLQVPFSKEIKTYGGLRHAKEKKPAQASAA